MRVRETVQVRLKRRFGQDVMIGTVVVRPFPLQRRSSYQRGFSFVLLIDPGHGDLQHSSKIVSDHSGARRMDAAKRGLS
ncbi:hypothetical protein K227x_41420 [Rubripirellula lacrimiformis]|uniref:Uncharacterized protein n=1 Tax=Rubripirellula lacrimiformis TaxID=1930273 RepID=A0A517NF29_9BACT|nr:hypothetical protein K227x_41420 [Rubripirellula lacrimiformis]